MLWFTTEIYMIISNELMSQFGGVITAYFTKYVTSISVFTGYKTKMNEPYILQFN